LIYVFFQGAAWNYGASAIGDMGGINAADPVYADHSVGVFGVTDTAYSGEATYGAGPSDGVMNSVIKVDPGTAASTAGHGIPGTTAGIP